MVQKHLGNGTPEGRAGLRWHHPKWNPTALRCMNLWRQIQMVVRRRRDVVPNLTSRSQLMEYLGAKQLNTVWSWCAVNDEERKVYLSIWTDTKEKRDGVRLSY